MAMLNFFGQLFRPDVTACVAYVGATGITAFQTLSDGVIAVSYFLIAAALLLIARRRGDLGLRAISILISVFLFCCATSYALDMAPAWFPVHRLEGVIRVVTAIALAGAVVMLFRQLPALMRLPSPLALQDQIAERERMEREMRDTNRYLELRVLERTNDLERTNLRLVESELRLQRILDGAAALVFVKDLQGRYTFVNKAFAEAAGLDRDQILGRTDDDLFAPEVATVYRANDRRALTEGAIECEEPGRSKGSRTAYLAGKFPLLDFQGNPYAICGMSTDISSRMEAEQALKRAHEELRNNEEQLRQIMDLVPDMLWSANVDTSCRFISQRYLDYTGYTITQFEGYGFLSIFHPEDRDKVRSSFHHSISTGDPAEIEVRIRRRDGTYRWFLSRTVPVWNENFDVEYLIGAVTDIHELKRTEQALRRSNEELEQFAYAAAHDLQEPLRNVSTSLGMLQRLLDDRMTEDEHDWIQRSIENAIRMQGMVKDLLLYSRVVREEDATVPPVPSETALNLAIRNLHAAISDAQARVMVSPLPEVPVREQHLAAVFQNLIGNSLKYRKPDEAPQISITANAKDSGWEFAVSDNGIGFDPAYADRIFKVFKRLHNRDEYPGNGIGLAICARIVAFYGGRIWAEAIPGEGATFKFTLPTQK